MIFDTLSHWRRYAAITPRFEPAFRYLERLPGTLELGRHDIDGDDIYALTQRPITKPLAEKKFEAHRRYIDVQYVVQGRELMFWAPLAHLSQVASPYNEKSDAMLFAVTPGATSFPVIAGQFAVFFPEDAHIPACAWGAPAEVTKVLVKVRI